jgi:hypothetical protein
MSAEKTGTYLKLHRDGMRGVPNVPAFSEADILNKLRSDRLFLIETTGGLPIGLCDLMVSPDEKIAHLEEIASATRLDAAVVSAVRLSPS